MKLIICSFFLLAALLVIGVDSVEFAYNETKIVDEYGDQTSLMYDGAMLTIVCKSQSEPELVVGGSVVPAKVEKMSSDKYNFTMKIHNETKLGEYFCKEKGQTGVLSKQGLKVSYRLCSDSSEKCQGRQCRQHPDQPFCAIHPSGNEYHCCPLALFYGVDLHPEVFSICTDNKYYITGPSLFYTFSGLETPKFMVDFASNTRKPCLKKLEFIGNDSKKIPLASAVFYSDNNVNLSCTNTRVLNCTETKKGGHVIHSFQPDCNTFLKLSEKRPEQVGSMVTKLTCYGVSLESSADRVIAYIFIVQMDTAHFFNDSAPCLTISPERKLLCGFVNPPSDSGFSVTANLSFNDTQLSSQSRHVAQFDVKDVGEYECQLTMKFKSCAMVMRNAFSKTVSLKFVLKDECFPNPTTTSLSNTPIAVEDDKSSTSNKGSRFKMMNFMCSMLILVYLIIFV